MRQVKNINTFPWWTTQNFTKNDVEKNRFEFLPFQSYQKSCSSAKENTTKTKSFVKFLLNSTTIQIQKVIQVLFSTSFLRWRQNIALPFEVEKTLSIVCDLLYSHLPLRGKNGSSHKKTKERLTWSAPEWAQFMILLVNSLKTLALK